MSNITLPIIGQEPWGENLNAYLADLEAKTSNNLALITAQSSTIVGLQDQIAVLSGQVTTLSGQVMANAARLSTLETTVAALTPLVTALESTVAGHTTLLSNQGSAISTNTTAINANTSAISALATRVTAVEARPEYVYGSSPYQFATQMPPATGSQVRMNNANPQLVTMLDFRRIDMDGLDRSQIFEMMTPDTLIRISDWGNSAVWYRFKVTGPKVNQGTDNLNIPVVYHSSAGTLTGTKVNAGILFVVVL